MIKGECWSAISGYVPWIEKSREERERFWDDLKYSIKCCEDKGRVVNDYIKTKVGDRKGEDVIGP